MSSVRGVRNASVLAAARAQTSLERRREAAELRRAAARMTATQALRTQIVPGFTRLSGNYGRYGMRAMQQGLKPELKFFDTTLTFNVDATGEVPATGQLCLIPQGDTESTRDGRLAYIKSIHIRADMTYTPPGAGNAVAAVWIYVVLDTQCNGAAAAVTDVFTSTALGQGQLNLNNSSRFRILKKFYVLFEPKAGAVTAWNSVHRNIDWYKRCNIKVDWSSTTGAITEIRSNNIFLIAGSAGVGNDDTVLVGGTCRLRFMG